MGLKQQIQTIHQAEIIRIRHSMFLEHTCNTADANTPKNEAQHKSVLRGMETRSQQSI